MSTSAYSEIAGIIQRRRTFKVMGDPLAPMRIPAADQIAGDEIVARAISDAGWAPFHYDRQIDGIAEPWRAYLLKQAVCREIAVKLASWYSDLKPGNKMPSMLSACGSVVLVTWLPQSLEEISDSTKLNEVNLEHLAAGAAMTQNLLLLLQANEFGSYWSSGGMFTDAGLLQRLGISQREKVLAAVYVEYPFTKSAACERIPGGNRQRRRPSSAWSRTVDCLAAE